MSTMVSNVNALPARTWVRLGVNDTEFPAWEGRPAPYRGNVSAAELPAGVSVLEGPLPGAEPQTGMGRETADWVHANRNCGVRLRSAAGTHAEAPVLLRYRVDEDNPAVVDDNTVVAEENSEITVVMNYSGESGFHGGLTRLYAQKGAVIHLVQVQLLGDGCTHFDDVGAFAEDGARIDVVQAELGAAAAFAGCRTRLAGYKSRLTMDSIYFGDRKRSFDFNYVVDHTGKKTRSDIRMAGALLDESQKTFRGTINFLRGAKQAVGHESESNLLFSPKVRSRTAPLILCEEEDVDGQHAASTGKVGEDLLFYLMTRGLSETDAKKLLIEARFRPVTDKIPDAGIRNAVMDYVKGRLSGLESMG